MSAPRRLSVPLTWLAILAALAARCGPLPDSAGPRRDDDVEMQTRDGVTLRAVVLRPAGAGPFPTLVYRTPYSARRAVAADTIFMRALERGYAVVAQDVRGRFRSDGEFRPYEHEGRDGYDTIEWAASQPWSTGEVGTFGLSYPGAVQWLAAVESPPHLRAMVPAMTFSTPQNFFYSWGVWDLSWISWIWLNIAPDVRVRRGLPGPRTEEEARQSWTTLESRMYETLPLVALDEMREVAPYYLEWLRHPPGDRFWQFAELRGRHANTGAAVLNLSGWYDDAYGPEGATTNFRGLVDARGGDASRAALLLGPWVHGTDATGRTRSGEREFGPAAAIRYDEVVLDWMDRHLRGRRPAGGDPPPVRYFVMGANRWQTASDWPPPAQTVAVPLRTGTSPLALVADPAHPVRNPFATAGAHDYRAFVERPDVLTFDTTPLVTDVELTGPIRVELAVSCDCRDLDLWARLLDVAPDGTAYNLMSPGLDVIRASYREPEKGRQLLTPGAISRLRLDHLLTSNTFLRGHRIRLQISGSFFPNFSRNLHTGDLETTSARGQRATIRLHSDAAHPSRIILPVAGPSGAVDALTPLVHVTKDRWP